VTRSEFQEAVHLGLGRAILYARDNDVQPFRDVILDACLHCYAIDPQCEGTRADYMLELVSLLPDRQFYCDEVLKALPGSGDDWDASQRFRFAECLAWEGDERAKQVMHESFKPGPRHGESIAINFVQLDGLKGFLFAASKLGSLFLSNPDATVDGNWLLSQSVEICGEQETITALLHASSTDPEIDAYRLKAEAYAANEKRGSDMMKKIEECRALSYEQLKPKMLGLRNFRLSDWGKHASEEEVERAAQGLLSATTQEERLQHLCIFRYRPFPLDPSRLVDLSLSDNERLGCAAADALTQITHPSVRETAFRLIQNRLPGREHAIGMLSQNWEPGDHELVLSWFENEFDPDARHRMQMDLSQLWGNHPKPDSEVRMQRSFYEHGPCSFCRRYVVERLIELDAFSESMRAECAHDANEEVRALAGAG
jgi:hypothetical protein